MADGVQTVLGDLLEEVREQPGAEVEGRYPPRLCGACPEGLNLDAQMQGCMGIPEIIWVVEGAPPPQVFLYFEEHRFLWPNADSPMFIIVCIHNCGRNYRPEITNHRPNSVSHIPVLMKLVSRAVFPRHSDLSFSQVTPEQQEEASMLAFDSQPCCAFGIPITVSQQKGQFQENMDRIPTKKKQCS